jgi:hypothetical protein
MFGGHPISAGFGCYVDFRPSAQKGFYEKLRGACRVENEPSEPI